MAGLVVGRVVGIGERPGGPASRPGGPPHIGTKAAVGICEKVMPHVKTSNFLIHI